MWGLCGVGLLGRYAIMALMLFSVCAGVRSEWSVLFCSFYFLPLLDLFLLLLLLVLLVLLFLVGRNGTKRSSRLVRMPVLLRRYALGVDCMSFNGSREKNG